MSINDLKILFDAYNAGVAGFDSIANQPRARKVEPVFVLSEDLMVIIEAIVNEIEARQPKNADEAENAFDVLVPYWGRACGDYAKATQIAVRLLPIIAANRDIPMH